MITKLVTYSGYLIEFPRFGDFEGIESEVILGAAQFIKLCKKLTLIIEDKHSQNNEITDTLLKINPFNTGRIDNHNIYASKI